MGRLSLRRMIKRKKSYYHQSRVPVDLQEVLGKSWINHSLKVSKLMDAERINVRFTSQLADLYVALRKDPHSPAEAQAKLALILGKKVAMPSADPAGQVPVVIPAKPDRRKVHRLSEVVTLYVDERTRNWGPRSKKSRPADFNAIVEDFQNPDITKITRRHVNAWITYLELHRNLAHNTVKRYTSSLSSVLDHARDVLGWITINPAKNAQITKGNARKQDARDAFTPAELILLFKDLQNRKAAHYAKGTQERYWVPLLMAYSGARVNEICQLRVEDVFIDNEPHPYFSITLPETKRKRGEKPPPDPDDEKFRVKTTASVRRLPLHPVLMTLGFGVYVRRLQEIRCKMLFPSLKFGPNGYSHYFVTRWTANDKTRRTSYRWYNKVLGDDCEKGNHSFRHTFINLLKQGLLGNCLQGQGLNSFLENVIEEISGHSVPGETWNRYGKDLYLSHLAEIINKCITHPFLPEITCIQSDCHESIGRFDEYGEVTRPNGMVISTFSCENITVEIEHDGLAEPEPNPSKAFFRPDLHGYSDFHNAIPAFFPEPSCTDFVFISHT